MFVRVPHLVFPPKPSVAVCRVSCGVMVVVHTLGVGHDLCRGDLTPSILVCKYDGELFSSINWVLQLWTGVSGAPKTPPPPPPPAQEQQPAASSSCLLLVSRLIYCCRRRLLSLIGDRAVYLSKVVLNNPRPVVGQVFEILRRMCF